MPASIIARRLSLALPRAKLADLALMTPNALAAAEQGKRPLTAIEQQRLELALTTLEEAQARIRHDVVLMATAS